jgi:hypothetical protein
MAEAVDALGSSDFQELGVEDGGAELRAAVEDLVLERQVGRGAARCRLPVLARRGGRRSASVRGRGRASADRLAAIALSGCTGAFVVGRACVLWSHHASWGAAS